MPRDGEGLLNRIIAPLRAAQPSEVDLRVQLDARQDRQEGGILLHVEAPEPPAIYGYDLVISLNTGGQVECHYVGTEATCRRKALMRPHAKEVLSAEPLTEEQYVRAYGRARRA